LIKNKGTVPDVLIEEPSLWKKENNRLRLFSGTRNRVS